MAKVPLTFASTGPIERFTREELNTFLSEKGHKLTETLNNDIDFLICNEKTSDSAKFKFAQKKGIGIINEDDFMAMMKLE